MARSPTCSIELPVLDASLVERFADLFGDTNPLHRAGPHGVPVPLVPGALLSVLVEGALETACPDEELLEMQISFLAPVPVGATLSLSVRDGPRMTAHGMPARRIRISGSSDGKLSYIAECVVTAKQAGVCGMQTPGSP